MERIKLLIVEDQAIIAKHLRQKLEGWGYAVSAIVTSSGAAIERAAEMLPDLVLMEAMLEDSLEGLEVADEIYHRLEIPVLLVTALDPKILAHTTVYERFGYLAKPFQEEDLALGIELTLLEHRIAQELRERAQWRHLPETPSQRRQQVSTSGSRM